MDSYKIWVVRDRDIRKEFRFTHTGVIDLVKNNKGKNFILTIKAYSINAGSKAHI